MQARQYFGTLKTYRLSRQFCVEMLANKCLTGTSVSGCHSEESRCAGRRRIPWPSDFREILRGVHPELAEGLRMTMPSFRMDTNWQILSWFDEHPAETKILLTIFYLKGALPL
jgi:hypothetical protein